MKRLFTLFIFSLATFLTLSAQPLNKPSYDTMIETAEELVGNQDYYNALEWYEKAFDEREERALIPIIAKMNYELRDYARAERWYTRLLRRAEDTEFPEERFLFARSLKMQGKYDEAMTAFQEYLLLSDDPDMKKKAQNEINGIELAMVLPENPQGVTIESAGRNVNSPTSEYSPTMSSDGQKLYFAALEERKEVTIVSDAGDDFYAKIFQSAKDDDEWDKPEALDEKINRPGFHSVNPSVTADGRRMYFNRVQLKGNKPGETKIYLSEYGDGGWLSANEVEGVNGDYLALHPTVGELFGKEVLFFVSDMEGGHGGYDIYYATYLGAGKYSDPVNLGATINSIGNEYSPHYHDGTLYFSSDGHPGLGGYDIFYSVWDGSAWSEPKNMGKSFNSSVDDLYFRLDESGYNGYFTSNRPEGRSLKSKTCCDDIYSFSIAELYADLVVGVFSEDKKPLKGATVSLMTMVNDDPGSPDAKTNDRGNRFDYGLELEMPYKVVATKEGYYPDSVSLNTVGLKEAKTFEHRFFLKMKPVPPAEPEIDTITIEEAIVLENILYDFDDDRIKDEAESDLTVVKGLLEQYPDMRIELSSHTDYRGDDDYNQKLSQRRAESARRWLVRNGVTRSRIEAVGYGETKPQTVSARVAAIRPFLKEGDVLTPEYIDALATDEEKEVAHLLNRRTEFKIIEGPTSITIKRTELRKKPTSKPSNDRKSLPVQDTLKVSEMSSLYGKSLKDMPIMEFDERKVELGTVKKGETREFKYRFVNKGETPLSIGIVTACECTTADYSKDEVAPGEEGFIHILFDSTEKDYDEVIDVTVMLNQNDVDDYPIIENLEYSFKLEK
ncbi:MAG: OmpA family protein [Lewinella sp.]|nr:OmpA family protein [Lewinella sp.]